LIFGGKSGLDEDWCHLARRDREAPPVILSQVSPDRATPAIEDDGTGPPGKETVPIKRNIVEGQFQGKNTNRYEKCTK
jgi:hypothetical protein